jgi:hypothetical protein
MKPDAIRGSAVVGAPVLCQGPRAPALAALCDEPTDSKFDCH